MAKKYYVVSEVDKEKPVQPHSPDWPKLIAFSFDGKTVLIKEGRGHGLAGGEMLINSVDVNSWRKTFSDAGADWFREILEDGTLMNMDEDSFKKELVKRGGVKEITY